MPDFFSKLFDSSDFPERWNCGTWSSFHGWLHIVSDLAAFAAYVTIPFVLIYFFRRRKEIPFPRFAYLFAAFVFTCSMVHLVEATIFWWPIYRVSGSLKFFNAIVSWMTVVGLIRFLPTAIAMRSPGELEAEIFRRNEAELKFRALLESAPDATVITSESGDIVLVNKQAERMFGFKRKELLGQQMYGFILFQNQNAETVADGSDDQAPITCKGIRGLRKEGTEFPVEISQSPIQTADGPLISNAIRDISERLARQKELEQEHAKLEAIVNAIPDALMFANTERKITYCNPAVKHVFGYEPHELIGQSTSILYANLDDHRRQGRDRFRVDAEEKKKPFYIDWKRKSGAPFPGETIGTIVLEPSGKPIGFLGLIRDITDVNKAKESLRIQQEALQSERKLADEIRSSLGAIVEESLDEIFVIDAEFLNFVQVNRGARENIGYEMDELLTMSPIDIHTVQTAETIQSVFSKLRSKEENRVIFNDVLRRKDGSLYDVEIHLQLGKYLGRPAYVAFVQDLTQRNQIQNALRESEQRFVAFMDNSPFTAWVKDSQGRHKFVSRACEKEMGIPANEWLGKTDFDFWPKEIAESHYEMDVKLLKTGSPITFESNQVWPNGKTKNWFVVKFPFNVGNEVLIGGIAVDMSEQRRAESERDRFFETSSEIMCIANFDGYFTRVNQAFMTTLGYTREKLLSRPFTEFVHPNDLEATKAAVKKIHAGGRVIRFENRFRHKNGSYRLISWTTPVPDAGAAVVFALGRDITEQRSLERSLLQIADNEQRRIAHDIHDGLGQELAGASMMARSLANKLEGKARAESQLAAKIANQLGASLKHTRAISRGLRPVEIDEQGLQSALLQLADRTTEAYPVKCSFHGTGGSQPHDPESATHLYRIAQEAVTNAAKHGNPQTIEIYLGEDEHALELKVVDDGRGMTDSMTESSKGIGMKSMQYRSNIIGARLHVESNQERGTVVVCRLSTS